MTNDRTVTIGDLLALHAAIGHLSAAKESLLSLGRYADAADVRDVAQRLTNIPISATVSDGTAGTPPAAKETTDGK